VDQEKNYKYIDETLAVHNIHNGHTTLHVFSYIKRSYKAYTMKSLKKKPPNKGMRSRESPNNSSSSNKHRNELAKRKKNRALTNRSPNSM
jgi:hypothetical protein